MQWLRLFTAVLLASLASCSSPSKTTEDYYDGPRPVFVGSQVYAPRQAPAAVHKAVAAANSIQNVPYQYGGGHGSGSGGLDCSGSTSYVLRSAGLLGDAMPSGAFRDYGKSGPGKWITVYARDGHVFMTLCGLRLDTTSSGNEHAGPRWVVKPRNTKGFKIRHPAGL